jgi:hypothetical protein
MKKEGKTIFAATENGGLRMENEVRIEARPWKPQDLIDDLQLMIDEEPDRYLNGNRTTLCMARDYLKKFFSEESLRQKGRWKGEGLGDHSCSLCCEIVSGNEYNYCPNCGAKMTDNKGEINK